jgi:SOS-response transcriptional repressor LexA
MIGVYERGEASPTTQQLEVIARAMDLDLIELLSDPETPCCCPACTGQPRPDTDDHTLVPYLEVWDGGPVPEQATAYWPVKRRILPHRSCLTTLIRGDAMYPFLLDRDVVLVDPKVQSYGNGNLVMVRSRGEILSRRLIRIKRQLTLEASNHCYLPIPLTDENELAGRIIALVERTLRFSRGVKPTLPPPP